MGASGSLSGILWKIRRGKRKNVDLFQLVILMQSGLKKMGCGRGSDRVEGQKETEKGRVTPIFCRWRAVEERPSVALHSSPQAKGQRRKAKGMDQGLKIESRGVLPSAPGQRCFGRVPLACRNAFFKTSTTPWPLTLFPFACSEPAASCVWGADSRVSIHQAFWILSTIRGRISPVLPCRRMSATPKYALSPGLISMTVAPASLAFCGRAAAG